MALCVKQKTATTDASFGLFYSKQACACPLSLSLMRGGRERCRGEGVISFQRSKSLGVASIDAPHNNRIDASPLFFYLR